MALSELLRPSTEKITPLSFNPLRCEIRNMFTEHSNADVTITPGAMEF